MTTDAPPAQTLHAGRLVARRLRASGVDTVFTLSGGHLFSIYDGCRDEGIRLIDTRHEQTATFAAEGWSKVTRSPGVAALTAGPGITNGISAMAAAQQNQSPLVVLGGRAPAQRWGMGSLQEIDHVPFVAPLARFAATAQSAEEAGRLVDDALRAAVGAPSGVGFVDFPMDHVFSMSDDDGRPGALVDLPPGPGPDGDDLGRAAALLSAVPIAAFAKGNLAVKPVKLPEMKIDTVKLQYSQTEFQIETGKYYWWTITCDGEEEDIALEAPELFRASWIYQIVSGDDNVNEVHTQALSSIEFDGEGSMTIEFIPLQPGQYDFYTPGYENRGLKGTVSVN